MSERTNIKDSADRLVAKLRVEGLCGVQSDMCIDDEETCDEDHATIMDPLHPKPSGLTKSRYFNLKMYQYDVEQYIRGWFSSDPTIEVHVVNYWVIDIKRAK